MFGKLRALCGLRARAREAGSPPGALRAAHHLLLGFLRRQTTGTGLINQPSTR
jgi:hypothetical protein